MQPLQICIGPTIRIGRESWCLPYAGFFKIIFFNETGLENEGRSSVGWAKLVRLTKLS